MSDHKIEYQVTAKTEEFDAGMERVKSLAESLENPFAQVGEVLAQSNSKALGVLAGVATQLASIAGLSFGLESVAEGIEKLGDEASALKNLQVATGVSAEMLSQLTVAAKLANVSTDLWRPALVHLTEAITKARTEGGATLEVFQRLGVTQDDLAKGDLLEILFKISDAYEHGADNASKLAINNTLLGAKLVELLPIINNLKEKMKEAHESNLRLNGEDISVLSEYKERVEEVGNAIAGAFQKGKTALAEYVNTLARAAKSLPGDFRSLYELNLAKPGPGGSPGTGQGVANYLGTHDQALTGPQEPKQDLGAQLPVFDALRSQLKQQLAEENVSYTQRTNRERQFWRDKLEEARAGGEKYKETAVLIQEELSKLDEKSAHDSTRVQQWDQQIAAQKTAFEFEQEQQGTHLQFSAEQEAKYWRDILDGTQLNANERLDVERRWLAARQAMRDRDAQAFSATLREQEARYKTDIDAKLTIARQAQAQAEQLYGVDSKQYQEASRLVVQIGRDREAQLLAIRQQGLQSQMALDVAAVEAQQRLSEIDLEQGLISQAEQLSAQATFEQRIYEIKRAALEQQLRELSTAENDPTKKAALDAQLEAEEQQHQQRLAQIRAQQRGLSVNPANFVRDLDVGSAVGSMQSQWSSGIQKMLQGTLHFRDAVRGAFQSIKSMVFQVIAEKVSRWIVGEAAQGAATLFYAALGTSAHVASEATKTGATVIGTATRTGVEAAAAGQSIAMSAMVGLKDIAIKAIQAAAGAYSAIASIPYVGPFLAPVVAAATLAAVIGLGAKISSASGGYDIPAGVNPVTQLHAEEMVLPAKYADVIRGMAGGSVGGMSGGDIHIHAVDARSFVRLLHDHGPALVSSIRKQVRNFNGAR